jgi:hypothetical protein
VRRLAWGGFLVMTSSRIAAAAVPVALLLSCTDSPADVPSASPSVVSASPTPNEQPSPSASPSGGGFEEALEATEGLTFSDPEGAVKRSQLRAIRGSIKGVGRIQGVTVKSVQTDGEEPTIVALAVIAPVEGSTSREVFGRPPGCDLADGPCVPGAVVSQPSVDQHLWSGLFITRDFERSRLGRGQRFRSSNAHSNYLVEGSFLLRGQSDWDPDADRASSSMVPARPDVAPARQARPSPFGVRCHRDERCRSQPGRSAEG